jgi:hypothetical protein
MLAELVPADLHWRKCFEIGEIEALKVKVGSPLGYRANCTRFTLDGKQKLQIMPKWPKLLRQTVQTAILLDIV